MAFALAAGGTYATIAANGEFALRWALPASVIAGIVGFLGAQQVRQIIARLDRAPSGQTTASRSAQHAPNHRPAVGAPPLPESTGPGFVGRDVELEQLRRALAEVRAGQGRLVLVSGEPGIGKSSIAFKFAGEARALGMQVLYGRMWETGGAPAFWPWMQILRSGLETWPREQLDQVLGADAAVIVPLVPEIAEHLPGLPDPSQLDAAEAPQFRLFDTVTRVLERAASTNPLVVVLDDLHRTDVSSLQLLQFLAQQMGDTRLLVIGTFRDAQADMNEDFAGVLAELGREPVTRQIKLDGLGKKHVACLVQLAAGVKAAPGLVAKLYERTDGNPLFLTHLIQPLAGQDDPDLVRFEEEFDKHVPRQVQEAVQQRLRQLPEGARAVLDVASVIGREFHLNALQAVSGNIPRPYYAQLRRAPRACGHVVGGGVGDAGRR